MNILALLLQVKTEQIPEPLSWGIVVLLSGVIVWTLIRYISKLDAMLQRLDDSIDSINKVLIDHAGQLKNNEAGLRELREANRAKPRR
jgi:hypothetical protein